MLVSFGCLFANVLCISGRLDRKIEIPLPNESSRLEILKVRVVLCCVVFFFFFCVVIFSCECCIQIHATKISKHGEIDYEACAKLAEGFNG
jgi:26S proteasome regulatory subunit T4